MRPKNSKQQTTDTPLSPPSLLIRRGRGGVEGMRVCNPPEYTVSSPPTPYSLLPTPYGQRGLTLLEIITVLAIVGLVAGALTPVVLNVTRSNRDTTAREELQTLKRAIIGDPLATQWGREATFGYVGDMGGLPGNLQDLYTQPPGVAALSVDSNLGISSGWRGPYTGRKAAKGANPTADFLRDPYGNAYVYSSAVTTDATLGAEVRGIIRSSGRDGIQNTSDDLTIEILKSEVVADVAGKVKDSEGAGLPGVSVNIYYPSGGSLTYDTTTTDSTGWYQFADIPFGERAITVSPGLVYVPGSAYAGTISISGTTQTYVSFNVANLSSSDITLTFITPEFNTNPISSYEVIAIKDVSGTTLRTVSACKRSGETVDFSSLTLTRMTMQRSPSRFLVQSQNVELPDIELSTVGAGVVVNIEFRNFTDNDSCTGNPMHMAGIPFTVTFSNGSVVMFTPKRQ
jgi:prepilin-type N-terminal cleavage/methylation domain-containing protein